MGNTLTAPSFVSTQQDLPSMLIESIPAYVHHSVLGGGKIFRTVQCLHEDGLTVVKIYIRRDGADGGGQLKRFEARLDELAARTPLSSCPSVLNLIKLEITERAVFLGRQYLSSNLVDRFHVHPSLHLIEKQWFTFQMLQSLLQLHARGIRHGDIKTENFLLTSWNWIFLVDIAFYKPTFLPSDNPADFAFYFEGQSHIRASNGMITQQARRRCYLAPERFYNQITDRKFGSTPAGPTGNEAHSRHSDAGLAYNPAPAPQPSAHHRGGGGGGSDGQVTEAMDVFSLGCVIAELFLNGESVLFDLPNLLAYREGSYDPSPTIAKIPYPLVRQLIQHMIQRDPTKRFSAKQYLKVWAEGGGAGGMGMDGEATLHEDSSSNSYSKPPVDPLLSPSLAPTSSPSPTAPLIGAALFPPYFPYLYKFFAKLLSPELADPDIKIAALRTHQKTIVQEVLGRAYWEQMMARAEAADAIAAPPSSSSAPDETDLAPSKPASSSSLPAFASAAAKGAKLLDEFATFSRALERDTQGLRTLEQLRAESDTTRANARNAAAAAQDLAQPAPLRSQSTGPPQPSPSPTFNPSSAPSAVTSLLDLASAARTPPQGSSALTGADKTGPLGGFSLDSGSSPAAAAASASPSLPFHGNGLTMITSIVCSCIQNVRYPITKLTALELLAEFGQYVDDEVRLGRLVPYAVALLADPSSMVRATSCHILTKLLSQTQAIHSASDAHLFAEYILPALSRFTHDPEETVRLAYAQNIAELAASSKRFLDLAQTARQVAARQAAITAEALAAAGGGAAAVSTINSPTSPMTSPVSSPNATAAATAAAAAAAAAPLAPFDATYQQELALLQDTVLKLIIDMLTIGGSRVKRALLGDITRLCIFMGRARVNNDLLPHLITVLNDRDWQLRSAFFEYIVGISVFVGKIAFNNFVLPCIEQSLTDIEEFVTQRAVHALTALSTLGLFEKRTVVEIAHKVAPLLCHPSAWIRHETIKLVASMAAALGPAKSHVFLVPLFRPFLREPPALGGGGAAARIVSLTQESLVQNLKPHLTREEFRIAVQTKADEAAEANQQAGQAPAAAAAAAAAASKPSSSAAASGTAKTRLADIPEPDAASASSLSLSSSGSEGGSNGSNGTDASSSSSAMRKAAGSSGFAEDPALFAVMNAYLGRVSQAVRRQAGGAQSPSGSASQSGLLGQPVNTSLDHLPAAGAASLLLRGGGSSDDGSSSMMDDDSFLIELQNLTLSTTLEEQIPLHQLDIERTMPEVLVVGPNGRDGSGYNPTQDAFEAGGGGGGAAGGNNAGSQQSGGGRLADPSLVPSQSARVVSGAASGANTAGATAQGGHPVPIKESLSMTPSYVIKALGVPLPPPQLGALRPDWISYSSFYQNHPVLDANSYAYSDSQDPRAWRPKGVLVATLAEHKAAVTSLAVARDNLFLASGGDEGIVKIWDAGRLKLTAHARSQLSYAQHGRITSLTVCDSSHSVASASSNGSVHVFKVEYASAPSDSAGPDGSSAPVGAPSSQRYLGLSEVRRVDPDPVSGEGSVLSVAHFNTLSESMLVYATQKAVHGWDLRSKKDVFELRLEPSMGVLTALSLGPTPYALVTGTARGFISVWDLRFQIPVQVWRHSAKTAITSLTSVDAPSILPREIGANGQPAGWMHPVTGPLVFAAAEGTNQISGFDIYTGENRMLFRVLNSLDPSGSGGGAASGAHARKESLALNAGASLNSSAAATVKSRQKVQVSPLSLPSLRSYIREGGSAERGSASKSANAAATAYSACSGFYQSLLGNTLDESFLREFSRMGSPDGLASAASTAAAASASAAAAASSTPASIRSFLMCKEAFAMTAGTDKLVRYWDMREPADSYRVCGADLSPNDHLRYNSRFENTTVVLEEVLSNQAAPTAAAGGGGGGGPSDASVASASSSSPSSSLKSKFVMARKTSGQMAPSTAHTAEILDMKALEFPQKMIATAARDGVIKIWI